MDILSKAKDVIVEYDNIAQEMINPDNMLNQEKMTQLLKTRSTLEELYTLSKRFIALNNELNDLEELSKEEEMEEKRTRKIDAGEHSTCHDSAVRGTPDNEKGGMRDFEYLV